MMIEMDDTSGFTHPIQVRMSRKVKRIHTGVESTIHILCSLSIDSHYTISPQDLPRTHRSSLRRHPYLDATAIVRGDVLSLKEGNEWWVGRRHGCTSFPQ